MTGRIVPGLNIGRRGAVAGKMSKRRIKRMARKQARSLDDLVKHVGRYPEGAFLFIREGLTFASERVHGPETDVQRALQEFLQASQWDWSDATAQYYAGALPEPLMQAIADAGGWEKMNRHVSGRELCWALRDYAIQQWGYLARTVLDSWNIRTTADFGRIVFGFIDFDLMQKQADDSADDFKDVFGFEDAFEVSYRTAHRNGQPSRKSDD
jgi:uncharacterized repeat protein (TIGR04138 family)